MLTNISEVKKNLEGKETLVYMLFYEGTQVLFTEILI